MCSPAGSSPVHAGATVSDTIVAVLEREPDWGALPEATPPGLRRVLRRCLTKDPARRLHDIADARIEIEEALDGIKIDTAGNVYLAAPDGLRIYSASGKHLGTVIAPRPIHNFAWGGDDGKTLYLTARDRLYRIALLVEGVRP